MKKNKTGNSGKMSRSEFLSIAGASFSFMVGSTMLGRFIHQASAKDNGAKESHADEKYDPRSHAWVYLIDTTKCIGCGMCVRACKIENKVPDHFFRTWVERYLIMEGMDAIVESPDGGLNGFKTEAFGKVDKAFFVPKICNHCQHSPCSQVCPVGASYYSPDKVQLIDQERCIGCGYCVQACPYGSRFLDPVKHVASKCTWCYHRITKGYQPACVQSCPTGTRQFGDMTHPDDPVRNIIANNRVQVLRKELLTMPQVKYLGLDMEVR